MPAFVDRFVTEFLRLPEAFNRLAAPRNVHSYLKAYYSASVRTPFGDGLAEAGKLPGHHCRLTVMLEPMGEQAAVASNTAAFVVGGEKIHDVVFEKDLQESRRPDLPLTEANCQRLLAELEAFCEQSLPDAAPT